MHRHPVALALGAALVATTAHAVDPLEITLRFDPQQTIAGDAPDTVAAFRTQAARFVVEDGRPLDDPALIGEGTDDDDNRFDVLARNSVPDYASDVLRDTTRQWGILSADDAELVLHAKLIRFWVAESNKPVGSTYNADVEIEARLDGPGGKTLWDGSVSGDASRYGRKASEDNYNEVISDALNEALANLFDARGLQNAWAEGATAAPRAEAPPPAPAPKSKPAAPAKPTSGPGVTPDALLVELLDLQRQEFSTELLVTYVEQKTISREFNADDLLAWKEAGLPEKVIQAALARSKR